MMVTIASFSFPHEAHIARAKLESEGIPAFVADEHTINMQWLYSNALGGVRVQVPEPFAKQANEILSLDYSESLVAQQGQNGYLCPKCGSHNTEFMVKGKRIAFFVFIVLHFPLWPFKRKVKCNECGAISDYKT